MELAKTILRIYQLGAAPAVSNWQKGLAQSANWTPQVRHWIGTTLRYGIRTIFNELRALPLPFVILHCSFAPMSAFRFSCAFALCLIAFTPNAVLSAEPPEPKGDKPADGKETKDAKPKTDEKLVDTQHTVSIDGKEIRYTARAGTILLRDAEDKPTASIFYIAYTRLDTTNAAERPLTFSFNGGPGSSSVWLHMGLLGPRRVVLEADGSPVAPPYRLTANEHSSLDVTDLVFMNFQRRLMSTSPMAALKSNERAICQRSGS